MAATSENAWHVGDYGPLGWAETAVKAVAFVCAYIAFAHALDRTPARAGRRSAIAELVLIGVAEVGLIAAIGERLIEREAIAMGFVVFNNAAHIGMLYALLAVPGPGGLVSLFCGLMFTGEADQARLAAHERVPRARDRTARRPGPRARLRRRSTWSPC